MSVDLLERPIRKGRSKRVTMATRRRLLSRTPRAAAILFDEFDAGHFQGSPNRQVVSSRHRRVAIGYLGAATRVSVAPARGSSND